ncbi:PEPxxWA-CTERM sorting domain-containing protein [Phenylobacterium sp.]|uniref:PEPxxWA-CTERM sorting domain-containing protein n=1 Tax=Phenylobacterium sp. TaxID=1871053 RepID=UPI0025FCD798|nr:PEPxxWA-CTERM sorting domain-containing protein [Phenylobacterium sp.]MBX3486182.1 PEPxxWA-CTERM sorting domain-containing protein [Phenylobacterium sp.]
MFHKLFWAAALSAAALGAQAQAATVVFSDDFDAGVGPEWVFTTNYGGTAGIDAGGILGPYINAPPGGGDLTARATRTLTLLAGDYTLDLDAWALVCQGCTISYDVLFDGVSLTRTAGTNTFQSRSFDLGALSAGTHTITLGMHTTNASSGHFLAKFDNVVLTGDNLVAGVPEPATWGLMILGFAGAGAALRRRRAALA